MLIVIKILTWIASPLGILTLGGLCALLLLFSRRLRWLSLSIISLSVIQLIAFSSPLVADALLDRLENQARALVESDKRAEKVVGQKTYSAIVLLSSAITPAKPPHRPDPSLGSNAARAWHAAKLYHGGIAPKIIVSGGTNPGMRSSESAQTEAAAIKPFLLSLGIPPSAITLEEQSRTTQENATETKKLIEGQTAALVTSAFHMPRALKVFREKGLEVDAFPADFRISPDTTAAWKKILPNATSLEQSEIALKEYIALRINY